jgi:hypothetical protein
MAGDKKHNYDLSDPGFPYRGYAYQCGGGISGNKQTIKMLMLLLMILLVLYLFLYY